MVYNKDIIAIFDRPTDLSKSAADYDRPNTRLLLRSDGVYIVNCPKCGHSHMNNSDINPNNCKYSEQII